MKFTSATAIKNLVSLAAVSAGLAFMYQAPAANAVFAQSQSTEVSEIIPGLEVDDHSDSRTEASTRLASQEARAAQLAQWRFEVTHVLHRLNSLRNQKAEVGAWAKVYGAEMKGKRIFSKKIKAESVEVGADKLLSGGWLTGASFGYTNIYSSRYYR